MKHTQYRYKARAPKALVSAMATGLIAFAGVTSAAPYTISNVLVPPDQFSGEAGTTSAPVWKPHETDSAATPTYWISSNERGSEDGPPDRTTQFTNMAGISIFAYGTNAVLSTLNIEERLHPGGLARRHADEDSSVAARLREPKVIRAIRTASTSTMPRRSPIR